MVSRVGFEKALEAEQAFEDALGVIEPVDPEHHVRRAQRPADAIGALADARARGESGEVVGRDAEWKSADAHRAVMSGDLVARAVDAQAQDALATVQELDDVGAGVKADQI